MKMKKITKLKGQQENVFTEDIDYSQTGKKSIWGGGDPATLSLLNQEELGGKWLNLAAGDGRYNQHLLEKADSVVASDVDEDALNKLYRNTPARYRARLETSIFNIIKPFPLADSSFDGVLCMGTLHLFPKSKLGEIVTEIDRVLKHNGTVILDFATDIRRVRPDGTLYVRSGEPQYSQSEAGDTLRELFKNYKIRMHNSNVPEEKIRGYKFSCNFILLVGKKKKK